MAELIDKNEILKKAVTIPGPSGKSIYSVVFTDDIINAKAIEPITENCIACKYDEIEEEDGEHCKKCLAGDSQFELDKEFVESTIQERQAESDKFDAAYQDGYNCGYAQARFDYEQDPTTKNNLPLINTEGLDEEIRCTMCTNSMKSDRGCDGSCVVDKDMYKAVLDVIEKRIQPTTKNNSAADCISREQALEPYKILENTDTLSVYTIRQNLAELPSMGRYDPYTDKFIKE